MPPIGKWPLGAKLWLLASLAVIAINMFAAAAHGQTVTKDSAMQGYVGITDCDSSGKPKITLMGGRTPEEDRMTFLHEMVHVRQMNRHPGGCRGAMEQYKNDPMFRFRMEAEAYCVDTDMEMNLDKREWMLDKLSMWMFGEYGLGYINYVEARKIVHDLCNNMRGGMNQPP